MPQFSNVIDMDVGTCHNRTCPKANHFLAKLRNDFQYAGYRRRLGGVRL